jgi:hypothetical protein
MKHYLTIAAFVITCQFSIGKTVWFKHENIEEVEIVSISASESLHIKNLHIFTSAKITAVIGENSYTVVETSGSINDTLVIGNNGLTLDGPLTLKVNGSSSPAHGFITYDINPMSSTSTTGTQNTATVIPENSSTDVEIILEQSTDLVNWTPADPGTYTPSDKKRFFRVRAQSK